MTLADLTPPIPIVKRPLELRFTVPGPPVPKARARVVSRGNGQMAHAFTPAKTQVYGRHVALLAREARWKRGAWPTTMLYGIEINVHRSAARGDWDNFAKAICDACNGVLWEDDAQVREGHVVLRSTAKGAERVEIRVWIIGGGP